MKLPQSMTPNEVARRAGRPETSVRRRLKTIDSVVGGKLLRQTGTKKTNRIMVSTAILLREWPDVFRVRIANDYELEAMREDIDALWSAVRVITEKLKIRTRQATPRLHK